MHILTTAKILATHRSNRQMTKTSRAAPHCERSAGEPGQYGHLAAWLSGTRGAGQTALWHHNGKAVMIMMLTGH